jgi:hypothetical protein
MQGKLAAVRKVKQGKGLVRGLKSVMLMPSTLIPYDACAASEGTQARYQRMVSRRQHHSPGSALSVDSAAALTPINDVVRRSSFERQAKVQIFCEGKRTSNESDGTSTKGCKQFKCTWKMQWLMQRKRWASKKQDETKCHYTPFS